MSKSPSKKRSHRNDPRRERTRRALMDAALELMQEAHSFNAISLREVAREAGVVPSAFYRHFDDMSALGLALVIESLEAMRSELRQIRNELTQAHLWIDESANAFQRYLEEHKQSTHFLLRERYGSNSTLRQAIAQGLALQESELSTDLVRLPFTQALNNEQIADLSALVVNTTISYAEATLATEDETLQQQLKRRLIAHLRLIFAGVRHTQTEANKKPQGR